MWRLGITTAAAASWGGAPAAPGVWAGRGLVEADPPSRESPGIRAGRAPGLGWLFPWRLEAETRPCQSQRAPVFIPQQGSMFTNTRLTSWITAQHTHTLFTVIISHTNTRFGVVVNQHIIYRNIITPELSTPSSALQNRVGKVGKGQGR